MDPEPTSNAAAPQEGKPARPVRIHQSPLSVRAMRRTARVVDRLRAILGLQRAQTVDGVRYTETSSESLRRALSRRGSGSKEYIAEFRDGHRMLIQCTHTRIYADVMEPRLLPCYEMLLPYLRPGMRVLDMGCGTGYGSAWLLDAVGPSGAVVAVDRDAQSIQYAQRRYPAPNVAFEIGWSNALSGEIDGAFDLVVSLDALKPSDDANAVIREMWRVLAPGGSMLVVTPAPLGPGHARPADAPQSFEPRELADIVRRACEAQIHSRVEEDQQAPQIRWEESTAPPPGHEQGKSQASQENQSQAHGSTEQVSSAAAPDRAGVLVTKPK